MSTHSRSVASVVGPWKDTPGGETGLIRRCRLAWNKPFEALTNEELATFLRQRIASQYLIPVARQRIAVEFEDGTEMYDEELSNALSHAEETA